jgi:hypothetical protein
MTGAFEFEDVFKIIIGFRQRTAFAQREMYRVTFGSKIELGFHIRIY